MNSLNISMGPELLSPVFTLLVWIYGVLCDIWINLQMIWLRWCIAILVYLDKHSSPVLGAMLDDHNVTYAMRYFYRHDPYLTIDSAYRWLTKFGPHPNVLTLVFTCGTDIKRAVIDFTTDTELMTGTSLRAGSISLDKLSKILSEYIVHKQ